MSSKETYFLRVFADSSGNYGDLASVVVDEGRQIVNDERLAMARELATGETAFVNEVETGNVSIIHPQGEIDFAGVAALATAWLLSKLRGKPIERMQGRGGGILTWQDGDLTWVRANLKTMPPWNYRQLESTAAVERMKLKDTVEMQHTMVWAWIDKARGLIRARTFAADWDISEAEGNGSGAMVLAAQLGRNVEIKHGKGSVIFAKSTSEDWAEIGGRVVQDKKYDL